MKYFSEMLSDVYEKPMVFDTIEEAEKAESDYTRKLRDEEEAKRKAEEARLAKKLELDELKKKADDALSAYRKAQSEYDKTYESDNHLHKEWGDDNYFSSLDVFGSSDIVSSIKKLLDI